MSGPVGREKEEVAAAVAAFNSGDPSSAEMLEMERLRKDRAKRLRRLEQNRQNVAKAQAANAERAKATKADMEERRRLAKEGKQLLAEGRRKLAEAACREIGDQVAGRKSPPNDEMDNRIFEGGRWGPSGGAGQTGGDLEDSQFGDPATIGAEQADRPAQDGPSQIGGAKAYARDVEWVYRNMGLVVQRIGVGTKERVTYRWESAQCPPPSEGARGLLMWAAETRQNIGRFYASVVPKALSVVEEGVDSEVDAAEKKSLADVRVVLARFRKLKQTEGS